MSRPAVLVFLQDELIYMLRKLLLNIGDLPAQTSHILFNYLVSGTVASTTPSQAPLLIRERVSPGGADHVLRADALRVGDGRHLRHADLPVGGGGLRGGPLLQGPEADHEEGAV